MGGSEDDYALTQLLTLAGAKRAMAAAEAAADAQGYKVSIAICDAAGITTLLVRNADGHSGEEAMMKCKTAALFQVETSSLEAAVNVTQGHARTAHVQGRGPGRCHRRVRHLRASGRAHQQSGG